MTEILTKIFLSKDEKEKTLPEYEQTLLDLTEIRTRQNAIRSLFNNLTDPDLIESCIHEMNAIEARYRHLLRKIRSSSDDISNHILENADAR